MRWPGPRPDAADSGHDRTVIHPPHHELDPVDTEARPAPLPVVLTLCTGNAARSVMAGVMLGRPAALRVVTAGTHVVENQPTSRRTRDASWPSDSTPPPTAVAS